MWSVSEIHGPVRISFFSVRVRSNLSCWSGFGPIQDTILSGFGPVRDFLRIFSPVSRSSWFVKSIWWLKRWIDSYLSPGVCGSLAYTSSIDQIRDQDQGVFLNLIDRRITITGHITWFLFSFLFLRRSFGVDFISRKGPIRITVRHAG